MINLIRNEVYKIFHKKGIYILLAIVIGLSILFQALLNIEILDNVDFSISIAETTVKEYENGTREIDEFYPTFKAELDLLKIQKEKNIKYDSPEMYYINNVLNGVLSDYYSKIYIDKDETAAKELLDEYNEKVKELDNFDWKKAINEDLKKEEDVLEFLSVDKDSNEYKLTQEHIKILKYRLDMNIPYTTKESSTLLDTYISNYALYLDDQSNNNEMSDYQKKVSKANITKEVEEMKYKLDHKLINDNYTISTANYNFYQRFGTVDLFVVICIVLIAGGIISDEFNKGTIKQLLVRPYSRTSIIVSKMIASFIVVPIFITILAIVEGVIVGVMNGSLIHIFDPVVVYDFTTSSVREINVFVMCLYNFICVLPEIFIINLLVFLTSVITTNTSISTVIGLIFVIFGNMLDFLLTNHKIVSYFPQANWDLTTYLFGGISDYKNLFLGKAIAVDIVTILIFFIVTIIIFNKKDIKNQ